MKLRLPPVKIGDLLYFVDDVSSWEKDFGVAGGDNRFVRRLDAAYATVLGFSKSKKDVSIKVLLHSPVLSYSTGHEVCVVWVRYDTPRIRVLK